MGEKNAKYVIIFAGTAVRSDASLIVYTFVSHLQSRKVYL
jgi:hypothetical protein